jgi:hypothetical protein
LAGLRFEASALPLPETLPRMDVAGFVGFAASGPIDVPVAVEDVAQFAAIFGDDAPLAWDGQSGRTVYANLAASVRAFFRNGGARCWVVRVARRSSDEPGTGPPARSNSFLLPGLYQYTPEGETLACAAAIARSEGSWSDALCVSTTLEARSIEVLENELDDQALLLSTRSDTLSVGDLLRLSFVESPPSGVTGSDRMAFLLVDDVRVMPSGDGAVGSSRSRLSAVRVRGQRLLWSSPSDGLASVAITTTPPVSSPEQLQIRSCQQLTFALWWRLGGGQPSRVSGLGFAAAHPRYWAALPSDADWFADADAPREHGALARPSGDLDPQQELRSEAIEPRIPVAGAGGRDALFLPLTMGDLPLTWSTSGVGPDDALRRDGLATFDEALFLDPALAASGVESLRAEADFIRYQSQSIRALRGIHALLAVDEVTLIAVPDASLRSWSEVPIVATVAPEAPDPNPPVPVGPCGAARDAGRAFFDCDREPPPAPELAAPAEADATGGYSLTWSVVPGADYELEESLAADYSASVIAYSGRDQGIEFVGRMPGDYYYRVRARRAGLFGVWSTGQVIVVRLPARFALDRIDRYRATSLLSVHRALLRMCAARGDLFAVLTTPAHYLEQDAAAHADLLRSSADAGSASVPPIGFGEASALSYGALYFPWLVGREENRPDELRSSPPDGAASGILARRSIARGAWVAPANEPLAGVVALSRRAGQAALQDLHDAQVNVFEQRPQGFLALSADTLSLDEDLLPINVRRLLILLRRAALRLGANYVFEPNDATFRRLVERSFESLLGQMYERGAFAGAAPEAAFQVVAGPAVNPADSMDLGRFFVELRVAPSLPLSFLTLRLVQSGDQSQVTEER